MENLAGGPLWTEPQKQNIRYEGTEGLQGMYRGLMNYTVGIISKLAQVLTHIKRLNSVLEAMENEQSFLSKNPHCVWPRLPGIPSKRYWDNNGKEEKKEWVQETLQTLGRKGKTQGVAVCGQQKELKMTLRKNLNEPSAFSVSNTMPGTTEHPKVWESLIQRNNSAPTIQARYHTSAKDTQGKKPLFPKSLKLDLAPFLFSCVPTFYQERRTPELVSPCPILCSWSNSCLKLRTCGSSSWVVLPIYYLHGK